MLAGGSDGYVNEVLTAGGTSGIRDAAGYTEIASGPEKAKSDKTFTFRVTDVALSGYTYEPGSNVETEDSIAVP